MKQFEEYGWSWIDVVHDGWINNKMWKLMIMIESNLICSKYRRNFVGFQKKLMRCTYNVTH
jgi:hypothetical protein